MLTRQELHRLRGPAQLRVEEAEKMIEYIRSFGIMSGQPRDIFSKPISIFRDFVYLNETRRESVAEISDHMKYDGVIQDWYNWNVGDSGPPIKTDDPKFVEPYEDETLEDVILAIGVHYPATPSTEFYTANGRYRFSISDKKTDRELAEELVALAETPREQLKQSDPNWKHNDPDRYYIKTKIIKDPYTKKEYEVGEGMWFEKSNGLLNEPAVFMESIDEAYNTNGHIFFIIGNPRVAQVNFNAINYKVIS